MMACQDQQTSQEEAVIRTIGYHREGVNSHELLYVIRFDSHRLATMQALFTVVSLSMTSRVKSSIFDKLPNELMMQILGELDIQSYLSFRQANRLARNIASTLTVYRTVATYAPTCLLAMLRTGIAPWFTFSDIYRAMLLRCCEICQRPADYIYLPTATKACGHCIDCNNTQFKTVALDSFAKTSNWSKEKLRQNIPVLKCLPGDYRLYGGGSIHQGRRLNLININRANEATKEAVQVNSYEIRGFSGVGSLMASAPLPFFNVVTREVESFACKGCALDYMATLRRNRDFDHEASQRFRQLFTQATLLTHFRECTKAKELWTASQGGTVSIRGLLKDALHIYGI